MLERFQVNVPQEALDDLRDRLMRTRWPDEIRGGEWEYGSNLSYMKELLAYWRDHFDWRAQERFINTFSHFRTPVDEIGIHFIHERGKGPDPLPLIMSHGWPSSFTQMLKILPLLTDPQSHGGNAADAFDVIVPSLPGYGFSDRPQRKGMTTAVIANLWAKLMTERLGYCRFGAQGGDIGSGITNRLGLYHPHLLVGIHVTDVLNPVLGPDAPPLTKAERQMLADDERWDAHEGAYDHQQSTRPQTLAYGLNDSPAGLAAWFIEKFRLWSDCDGDLERRFTKDELLTNITLYWVTETINSSMRLYFDRRYSLTPLQVGERIQVPTGVALFPEDLARPPREWAERSSNVTRWTVMPRGGHFAALEEPELLVEDIRAFFRPLRGDHFPPRHVVGHD